MSFQAKVQEWMEKTFHYQMNPYLEAEAKSEETRLLRFLEESLELCQAAGLSKLQVYNVFEYVYKRPPGQPAQEVGGVMITLAAYCNRANIDMVTEGWREYYRIDMPEMREKIRNKQATKPNGLVGEEKKLICVNHGIATYQNTQDLVFRCAICGEPV